MPELPEVETTVAGLRRVMEGQTISSVELRREGLRHPFPLDLGQRLTGAMVTGLTRRAKYGLIHTDRNDTLIFHLGMSGRWRIDPDTADKHDHLWLHLTSGTALALNDARRFGFVDLVEGDPLIRYPPFVRLGAEPLDEAFDGKALQAAIGQAKCSIKTALLDQSKIAGVGNIYACEALYRAGIATTRPASQLSRREADRLMDALRAVLGESIKAGGSTLRDYAQPDGKLGYFAKDWAVYGKQGELCPRGHKIARRKEQGRSSFYCEKCQK